MPGPGPPPNAVEGRMPLASSSEESLQPRLVFSIPYRSAFGASETPGGKWTPLMKRTVRLGRGGRVVVENAPGSRQPYGYIVGAGLGAKISCNGQWSVGFAIKRQDISRAVYHGDYSCGWRSRGCCSVDDIVYIARRQGDGC